MLSLEEAIRRLTGLPATNLGLDRRGLLQPGIFADVVVFDPATIADRATYEKPHQYAVGVKHVFVNGVAGAEGRRAHRREAGAGVEGPRRKAVLVGAGLSLPDDAGRPRGPPLHFRFFD